MPHHRRRSHEDQDSSFGTHRERTKDDGGNDPNDRRRRRTGRARSSDDDNDSDDDDNDDDDMDSQCSRDDKRRKRKSRRKSHHHKSKKKNSKRHKSSRHRKSRDLVDDSSASSSHDSDDNNDDDDTDDADVEATTKYNKKRDKKKKTKKTKSRRRERSEPSPPDARATIHTTTATTTTMESRSHILTQALCHLFSQRPVFAQELPILLIRLAGGSTFDLRHMKDPVASTALARVLECLQEFGVQHSEEGGWLFQPPPGRRDERILLRIIRAQLDEVGVSMQAVTVHESEQKKEATTNGPGVQPTEEKATTRNQKDPVVDQVKDLTSAVVLKYQDKESDLGSQLAGLCQAIAQGESIFVGGIPDEQLKAALEEIFIVCGLEKSEMAEDDSDEEGGDDKEPTMGYGLPEEQSSSDMIQLRLAAVMEACRSPKRRTLGPRKPTEQEVTMEYSSGDDEGPTLPGHEKRPRGPVLPTQVLKSQSEYRELELKAAVAGVEIPKMTGGREEWMVVPGKYDFLSTIKSGQPMKSRGFQNTKNRGEDNISAAPIHPAVQAEMDAILQAHQDSRGPSLFDQHRAQSTKNEEYQQRPEQRHRKNGRGIEKAILMRVGGSTRRHCTWFWVELPTTSRQNFKEALMDEATGIVATKYP